MKDMKEALSSGRKPDITHMRTSMLVYGTRACEYGSDKYERANYMRPAGTTLREDFERFRSYLRACMSHVSQTLDAMERHQSGDPKLVDRVGMHVAAYAADLDAPPDCTTGPSGLPHVAHAVASLNMAIEQAVRYGLLPPDPGQPWRGLHAEIQDKSSNQCVFSFMRDVVKKPADDIPEDDHYYDGRVYDPEKCVHGVPLCCYCNHCMK